MQNSKIIKRNFDDFEEPCPRDLRLSTSLREFLKEIKIRNIDNIQELIEDRKRIHKVVSSWKRRRSGKIYIFFGANFLNYFFKQNIERNISMMRMQGS